MSTSYSRRKFLQSTGLAAAGALLAKNALAEEHPGYKIKNYGLQLWTVKEDMAKDPKGTLKEIAKYGYTTIEGFEGAQGMFWGMTPAEFEAYTRSLGIKMIGSHCGYKSLTGKENSLEGKAVQAVAVGMPYLICPWVGPQKSADDFKRIAEEFNKCGEICRRNGVAYGYHNHDYSFKPVDGQIPLEILLENTDHDSVVFEMDLYWAITAGVDPYHYFNKYNKRFRLVHVKDRKKDAAPGEEDASCDLGTGSITWEPLLHHAKTKGVRYFIVEQERFDGSTPMQSAEVDAKFLKPIIPRI